jgi:pimeloyl-ACP methyl ester carboxylesterase
VIAARPRAAEHVKLVGWGLSVSTIWVDLLGSKVNYVGKKYRTRVIEAGEGEALVLLHGGGGHAEAFSRNIMRLGKNFRTMAIDMVWHGLSSKPPFGGDAFSVYADQVIDLLDTLGIEKAHVEGEAIGGRVALWLGIHRPDRIIKLVLNNTGGVRFKDQAAAAPGTGQARYQTAANAAIENPTRESIRQRLERLVVTPDRVTDELVEIRYRYYSDPETNKAQLAIRSSSDFEFSEEEVGTIKAPTLVLATDGNPLRGPEAGQRLASLIRGAKFHLIKDSAIWMQWEHPEEHDGLVTSFLKGQL